jgi:hypothetical protein
VNNLAGVLQLTEDLVAVARHDLGRVIRGNDLGGWHRHRLRGNAHGLHEILEAGRRAHPQHAGAGRTHLEAVRHVAGAECELARRGLDPLIAHVEHYVALEDEEALVFGVVDVERGLEARRCDNLDQRVLAVERGGRAATVRR